MAGGQMKNPGARAAQPGLNKAGYRYIHDEAQNVTRMLRGKWHGGYGSAPCPCCQSGRKDQNALTIGRSSSGRLLLNCKRSNCSFTAILAAAGLSREHFTPDPLAALRYEAQARAEAVMKSAAARRVWDEAEPIRSSAAEGYFSSRGMFYWQHDDCHPRTLRCHPHLLHGPSGRYFPALLGLVEGGEGFAIHRTYLAADGSGKAAVESAKMMLGACAGGAVRLLDGDPETLVIGEGIESTISIGLVADDPRLSCATTWAALSASGMRGLRLPSKSGRLVIGADGDDAGRAAAHALAERASGCGWKVTILAPPEGLDFNDLLRGGEAVASC
jgi:hypothetical protein